LPQQPLTPSAVLPVEKQQLNRARPTRTRPQPVQMAIANVRDDTIVAPPTERPVVIQATNVEARFSAPKSERTKTASELPAFLRPEAASKPRSFVVNETPDKKSEAKAAAPKNKSASEPRQQEDEAPVNRRASAEPVERRASSQPMPPPVAEVIPDDDVRDSRAMEAAVATLSTFVDDETASFVPAAEPVAAPSTSEARKEASPEAATGALWGMLRKFASDHLDRTHPTVADDYVPDYSNMTEAEMEALAYGLDPIDMPTYTGHKRAS
jgi:hypothetical protein